MTTATRDQLEGQGQGGNSMGISCGGHFLSDSSQPEVLILFRPRCRFFLARGVDSTQAEVLSCSDPLHRPPAYVGLF